mgnify:CR=1 FL=1
MNKSLFDDRLKTQYQLLNKIDSGESCVSPEDKKSFGIVYTPQFLAEYVAQKTITYFLNDLKNKSSCNLNKFLNKTRVIDPACGDGQLLYSIWKQLTDQLTASRASFKLNPIKILCGIDIDKEAVMKTIARISRFSGSNDFFNFKIATTNALFPFDSISREEGWKIVKDRFGASEGFDILLANPPWGADITFKETLLRREYCLYKGPFESADLFIELALSTVKPGGYFAFILPDSLFSFERKDLREMLLKQTTIKFIARLGEKIFQDINRACAILICKKETPSFSHKTKCVRLTPEIRNEILLNKITFCEAESLLAHEVYQQRFYENRNFLFDIDVKEGEEKTLNKITSNTNSLRNYLISSRGVELSKTGRVCKCKECGLWMPLPVAKSPRCSHCNLPIEIANTIPTTIISKDVTSKAAPLIVGENIKRYSIGSNRWILTNRKGIKYKDKTLYENPKIIVRKTGVGISASIDYSKAYTNQVVYIFKLKEGSPVSLEFLLAIINSRLMYYYVLKNYGENEWRSHPYITQKQILALPLPDIDIGDGNQKMIIDTVTRILRPHLKKNKGLPLLTDARVEYLVAKFFKFTKKDYLSIFDALNKAEELLPVKALKQIQLHDIFSEKNLSSFIHHGI